MEKAVWRGINWKKAKLDFAVVYNLDEDETDGYTDWISPPHDHPRVNFTIGDSIWGDIPTPKPTPSPGSSPKGNKDTNEIEDGRHYPTSNIRQRDLHSSNRTNSRGS
jgi:hypothetical protein